MKICIAIYLVCSGYGLYKSYINHEIQSKKPHALRILSFLVNYWLVMFLVAVPYLAFTGRFEPKYLLVNLFALLHNDAMLYVSFSWYVKLYLMVLLFVPIMRWLDGRFKKHALICEIALYVVLPWLLVRLARGYDHEADYEDLFRFTVSSGVLFLRYLPIFYGGMFLAKYRVMEELKKRVRIGKPWIQGIGCACGMALILLLRHRISFPFSEAFYGCAFVVCCYFLFDSIRAPWVHRLLLFVGKHNFWYWMLSGMFFLNTSELQWILFLPRQWLLILIWTFLLLTPPAMLLEWLSQKLWSKLDRTKKEAAVLS